jgi:hypothetical protein
VDSIRKEFILLLEEIGKEKDFCCQRYESKRRWTKNIIKLYGSLNCLLYFKIRSEEWPMGRDEKNKNECKISPGKALQHKYRFYTFDDFINSLINDISNK